MIEGLKPYPTMKDSGVVLLKQIPKHWELRRLRNVADLRVSNIDKKTDVSGLSVRLCNYVDVYKNEIIRADMPFMAATATAAEIARFRLQRGDVLITKDSEDWRDIAVPAYVEEEAQDLVCGYHLAILRPFAHVVDGRYLYWQLLAEASQYQFRVSANGITRYGLSHGAIKELSLPVPPLDEQRAIVRFLDHADRLIRRYVNAKRKLIKLLEEHKQAIIHRAVTRGLDPNVRLKPSGVDWLGDIPEHWEVQRLKTVFREIDDRTETGTEVLLSLRMHRGLVPHTEVSNIPITSDALIGFKRCRPGQLVMNRMRAAIGMFAIARQSGLVSPDYAVFEARGPIDEDFVLNLLRTPTMRRTFRIESKGLGTGSSGFMRLYSDRFGIIKIALPPVSEQTTIVQHLNIALADLEGEIERTNREINLILEYRTRLITDVVTGKLDVHAASEALPDEADEPEEIEVSEKFDDEFDASEDEVEGEEAA
jgi:type I restriction enzyme, S subunit